MPLFFYSSKALPELLGIMQTNLLKVYSNPMLAYIIGHIALYAFVKCQEACD